MHEEIWGKELEIMARPIARRWASPGNLRVVLSGPVDNVEKALMELHELGITCAYDPMGTSRADRANWDDNQFDYRLATFSVDETDKQRVYQFASRRGVGVNAVTPAQHRWFSQGLVPFRLSHVLVRETPEAKFLKSAAYRKHFWHEPIRNGTQLVKHDPRPELEYPLYLAKYCRPPVHTAALPGANWYCVIDTQRGDIAALLTNVGVEVHVYALGADKPWRSRGTLATYFRGNAQLAALLRRTRFADTRPAHGLPAEAELKESLRQIQYFADLCNGRIKPKKRPKRAKHPQAYSSN